jgi:hypothetical protein
MALQAFELPPRSRSWPWRSDPSAGNGFGMPPVDQMQQSRSDGIGTSQLGGRNPARVTVTSRRTAALDGRLLAAPRAWMQ